MPFLLQLPYNCPELPGIGADMRFVALQYQAFRAAAMPCRDRSVIAASQSR